MDFWSTRTRVMIFSTYVIGSPASSFWRFDGIFRRLEQGVPPRLADKEALIEPQELHTSYFILLIQRKVT